jgi:hypothetical protein
MAAVLQINLTGGAVNSDYNLSLGGVMSSQAMNASAMNNLFDNVTPTEASGGDWEWRIIDIYNTGDASAVDVDIYMSTPTASTYTELYLGVSSSAVASDGNPHVAGWSGQTLATESTTPSNPVINVSTYCTATPLRVRDIPAASACRLYVNRRVTAGAGNLSNDLGTLTVQYA